MLIYPLPLRITICICFCGNSFNNEDVYVNLELEGMDNKLADKLFIL